MNYRMELLSAATAFAACMTTLTNGAFAQSYQSGSSSGISGGATASPPVVYTYAPSGGSPTPTPVAAPSRPSGGSPTPTPVAAPSRPSGSPVATSPKPVTGSGPAGAGASCDFDNSQSEAAYDGVMQSCEMNASRPDDPTVSDPQQCLNGAYPYGRPPASCSGYISSISGNCTKIKGGTTYTSPSGQVIAGTPGC